MKFTLTHFTFAALMLWGAAPLRAQLFDSLGRRIEDANRLRLQVERLPRGVFFQFYDTTAQKNQLPRFTPAETRAAHDAVIDTILIRGNEITNDFVIRRELTLSPDSILTAKRIAYDLNRLNDLKLFNFVDISARKLKAKGYTYTEVLIDVDERWRFFPYPVLGLKEPDFVRWLRKPTTARLYGGLGFSFNNFRGQNERIESEFGVGFDPYVSTTYFTPYIARIGEQRISLKTAFSYRQTLTESIDLNTNASFGYNERRTQLDVVGGYRLSPFEIVELNTGLFYLYASERAASRIRGATNSPTSQDGFLYLGAAYIFNSVNVAPYPTKGSYFKLGITRNGFSTGENDVRMFKLTVDARIYQELFGETALAFRALTESAFGGRVPNYLHAFIGYDNRIRGYASDVFEGDALLLTSIELRVPLLPIQQRTLEWVPLSPLKFLRYGVYLTFFFDSGTTWYNRDEQSERRFQGLKWDAFKSGYGFGINLVVPYNIVGRAELSRNLDGRVQFTLREGVSF